MSGRKLLLYEAEDDNDEVECLNLSGTLNLKGLY